MKKTTKRVKINNSQKSSLFSRNILRKATICLFAGCFFGQVRSQDAFRYRTSIEQVPKDGFYRIPLTPVLLATCKEDRSDIRIAGKDGKYISYVLKTDLPVFSSRQFLSFPILSDAKQSDSTTEIVIGNDADSLLNYLLLRVSNFSAFRKCTISGSDDRKQWYVIREGLTLEESNSDNQEYHLQSISFPFSRYRFFRIRIDDKGKLPIKILEAGVYKSVETTGNYTELPGPSVRQHDSADKHSYISLQFDAPYFIDRISLQMQGAPFYKRKLRILTGYPKDDKTLAEVILSPPGIDIQIVPVKTTALLIEIDNEDNPPLSVQKITAYQLSQYLFAWLQAGDSYAVLTGDSNALRPGYDLGAAGDSLLGNAREIGIGSPEKNRYISSVSPVAKSSSGIWLWLTLAVILLLTSFISISMIRSISERKKHDENEKAG